MCPTSGTAEEDMDEEMQSVPVEEVKLPRKYVFLELFAGRAGFSREVVRCCGHLVDVKEPLDIMEEWDILSDSGFEAACKAVGEADHTHMAFPCRSYTRARRSDEHGSVPVIRSDACPQGWGHPTAEEGNRILERCVALAKLCIEKGKTFSFENPEPSFAWLMPKMVQLMNRPDVWEVGLDQCPYGAMSVKATKIVTSAAWMKEVSKRCQDVRPHYHHPGGLQGKTWDPITWEFVWLTSKAAEYPWGLCNAWAGALRNWLSSADGQAWMCQRSLVRTSPYKLVRADWVDAKMRTKEHPLIQVSSRSKASVREEENQSTVGGLRDPRKAVAKSKGLQRVGSKIRLVLDRLLTEDVVNSFGMQLTVSDDLVDQARQQLHEEFMVNEVVNPEGYRTALFRAMLEQAEDLDAGVVPTWLEQGVPLGISLPIQNTGIFPATDDVSASIKASQAEGCLLEDWSGEALNYSSFYEAGSKAQSELDRLVETGRADKVDSWDEVVQLVGHQAKLTQLACIVKEQQSADGTVKEKIRLIVDMRRSGINGQCDLYERIVLPRLHDVAMSVHELFKIMAPDEEVELLVIDFSDAFYTLRLDPSERPWVCIKGLDSKYYLPKSICFGLASGPLLWGRVAACAMRLGQATCSGSAARMQCYVDDPVIAARGSTFMERSRIFLRVLVLWTVLGFKLAWHKAQRGRSVTWIGISLSFEGESLRDLKASLPPDKTAKILTALQEIQTHKGTIPTKTLERLCGLLAWVANLIPCCRPWVAQLWAAVELSKNRSVQGPVQQSTRQRKGLTFVKQIDHAVTWLSRMVAAKGCFLDGTPVRPLMRVFRWEPGLPTIRIVTDASTTGLGAVLFSSDTPLAYFAHELRESDCRALGGGARLHDPSFQSEWELLAIFLAVHLFSQFLANQRVQIVVQSDSSSALEAVVNFKAHSPLMVRLACELAIEVESLGINALWGRHIPGIRNTLADRLSRVAEGYPVPAVLSSATVVQVPELEHVFRAWPQDV